MNYIYLFFIDLFTLCLQARPQLFSRIFRFFLSFVNPKWQPKQKSNVLSIILKNCGNILPHPKLIVGYMIEIRRTSSVTTILQSSMLQ